MSISWAESEFGGAELGDARRTRRLVSVAARVAEHPGGRLTTVFDEPAAREGAYRLLSNEEVELAAVQAAMFASAAERAGAYPMVFVAQDQSSLAYTDDEQARGTGSVGSRDRGGRGFEVMSALAVSPDGVPLGVVGQSWWARTGPPVETPAEDREPGEKESRFWGEVFEAAYPRLAGAGGARPWFQMDRGADDWQVWKKAVELGAWLTVRSCYDRRVVTPRGKPRKYLRETLGHAPVAGSYTLPVAAGPGRVAREAQMEVRYAPVRLHMIQRPSKRTLKVSLWAVSTEEVSAAPPGESPIRWTLLTTRPVTSLGDALLVIHGYAMRWRIELFHKAWKSGGTRVEDSLLRSAGALQLWATVLAAVAVRLLRMTYLSRTTPTLPATTEFTADEIAATCLASRRKWNGICIPTIAEMTDWIARLGGYTGKSSGGPPGFIVLARGWARVEPVVIAVRTMRDATTRETRSDEW